MKSESQISPAKSKVGPVPPDWRIEPLSAVAKRLMVGIASAATHAYRDDGVVMLRNLNIKPGRIVPKKPLHLDPDFEHVHRRKRLLQGDILTVRTGEPGISAVVPKRLEGAQCFTSLITRLDRTVVDSHFICAFINSELGERQFAAGGAGGGQKNVGVGTLRKMHVPVPPLREQKAIARLSRLWDNNVRTHERALKLKRRLKIGLMQQLLTGRRRFPEFADQPWREVPIGELMQEHYRGVPWDDEAIYNLVSVRRRSGGFFFREKRIGSEIKTKVMQAVKVGDFVIARMQVIHGALAMVKPEFDGTHVSGSYTILIPRNSGEVHVPFLDYLSQTPAVYYKAWRSSYGVAIEKMTFSLKWFLKETLRIPPTLAEQQKIAAVLSLADREIVLLEKQLAALVEQRKGLMQKLLTGQVRLPEFRTEGATV